MKRTNTVLFLQAMANLIRDSKNVNEWCTTDLEAYRITVEDDNLLNFSTSTAINDSVLDFEYGRDNISDLGAEEKRLISYINLATMSQNKSVINNLSLKLLEYTNYDRDVRTVYIDYTISFETSSVVTPASLDVCLVENMYQLLLQESNTPEPQVIAKAIAMYQENNRIRTYNGLDELDIMAIPCITMIGTFPIFYVVPVTKNLSLSVIYGTYPDVETIVSRYIPNVMGSRLEGMRSIENRRLLLGCFEAFRTIVG